MTDQQLLTLSRCMLFKGLKLGEIRKLLDSVPHSIKKFDEKNTVMLRGDCYESLIIVLGGEIEAEIADISGKTIRIEALKSPSIAASGILFASDPVLPVTLTAVKGATLLLIPVDGVIALFRFSTTILLNYLRDTGDKINFLAEKIRLLKFSNLRQKTAGFILDLAAKQKSDTIILPYTKEKIAEIFGVTRPSLSRVFSGLSRESIISQRGNSVKIKNREKLFSILRDTEMETGNIE